MWKTYIKLILQQFLGNVTFKNVISIITVKKNLSIPKSKHFTFNKFVLLNHFGKEFISILSLAIKNKGKAHSADAI